VTARRSFIDATARRQKKNWIRRTVNIPPQVQPVDRDVKPAAEIAELVRHAKVLTQAMRTASFLLADALEAIGTHVVFDPQDFGEKP
jgi:hypothetical protein